jgi:glycosyltransferase involved in cell wall biosynthesis
MGSGSDTAPEKGAEHIRFDREMIDKDRKQEPAEPLVSVLTPVYNGEKYLVECIESVLAQTYQNWEYIIINNCSTDRSREIACAYAQKDARIRVHDNSEFLGAQHNHNIALRQISARSKYCKVVHHDDLLFPECLARMVAVAEPHPTVGIVAAYRLDGTKVNLDGLPYPSTIISGREMCRRTLLEDIYVFGSPTSVLIRSNLVRDRAAVFNESNIHADREACFDLLQESDFGFVHQVLTYTRRHDGAGTTFSKHFGTNALGSLLILKQYGPLCLDEQEFEEALRLRVRGYYRYLAQVILYRHDKRIFLYHKNGMKNLGYAFNWPKLCGALFLEIADILFNPKTTIERIVSKISKVGEESMRAGIAEESGRRHGIIK